MAGLVRLIFAAALGALTFLPAGVRAQTCAPHAFAPVGTPAPVMPRGKGPGLVLMGGGTPPHAGFTWLHDTIAGSASRRAGNLVVLRASGDDWSPELAGYAPFASVQTVLIPPCATRAQVDAVASIVDRADAVFFAGGDQANYVAWKGSRLIAAVQRVYDRGGVVGGTSAGLAIQGAIVYDSVAADRVLGDDGNVHSTDAARDPLEPAISFTTGFLRYPALASSITDTHFARRDRFGRLAAFMARALQEGLLGGPVVYGVAVDERSALVVDRAGMATLLEAPALGGYQTRGAYILTGRRSARLEPGRPLAYEVSVTHLSAAGQRYDLLRHQGEGERYSVAVDGARNQLYSRVPY